MSTSGSASSSSSEPWIRHPWAAPKARAPLGIEVRRRDQPDRRVGRDVARVAAGDVAGADDADAERIQARSLRIRACARDSIARADAVPSRHASRPDRPPALHRPPPPGGRPPGNASRRRARRATGRRARRAAGRLVGDGLPAPRRRRAPRRRVARGHRPAARRSRGRRRAPRGRSAARGSSSLDAPGGPRHGRADVQRFAAELGALAEHVRGPTACARVPQPRLRVRAGRAARRRWTCSCTELPADGRARGGRLLGLRRRAASPSRRIDAAARPRPAAAHEGPGAGRGRPRRPRRVGRARLPGHRRGRAIGERGLVHRRAGRAGRRDRRHHRGAPCTWSRSPADAGERRPVDRWTTSATSTRGPRSVRPADDRRRSVRRRPSCSGSRRSSRSGRCSS